MAGCSGPSCATPHDTIDWELTPPYPSPPSARHWLGTDGLSADNFAILLYGFRLSVLFGLSLTLISALIGVAVGALQGYLGGLTDLIGQRVVEIWAGLPILFVLIILSSLVEPNFFWLLGALALFSWMALVGVVRAEFLRARNFEFVLAARALGVARTHHHAPPCAAQRDGGDPHLPAVHPQWCDHHPDGARLSSASGCPWSRHPSAACCRRRR